MARVDEQYRSESPGGRVRAIAPAFVAAGPSGLAIRTRLKGLTAEDEQILRAVGAHLGSLASRDLKARCADGLEHESGRWAVRKRELTAESSARWAGSITKATHDQWALARRDQQAHVKARLASMAVERGLTVVAVDPAYTSKWGARHWREPMSAPGRQVSRHDAASIAVGRRALGHPIRRRTAPPPHDRSDRAGHRTVQAGKQAPGREGPRRPDPDRAHDARPRGANTRTRATSASNTVRDARSTRTWVQTHS